MKKIMLGLFLTVGACSMSFAKENSKKVEEPKKENKEVKKKGTCLRCTRSVNTIVNDQGVSETTTVQYCYTIPC